MQRLARFGWISSGARATSARHLSTNPDERIARAATLKPVAALAEAQLGISADELESYGKYKAKVPLPVLKTLENREDGKLVLVTALTPTKAGEGKTCTSVGLADGLARCGANAMVALREPSLGPVFGMKGGAAGGGYAQVVPMGDINLHFTGDMHAIGAAHNLLSAAVDNHLHWKSEPTIDPGKVEWRRVVDMNDRALRSIVVGLGGATNGVPREDGYDITVASEVMAIFCLATDAADLQRRLGNIVVGYGPGTAAKAAPVTARDLKVEGAMAALLRDAIQPNLVQTLEHNLALVHGGPFANIAHGCSSVVATKAALKLSDYVVTEAGFGADLGAQKFFDIKCRKAGLRPDIAVVIATVRALKLHGGADAKKLEEEDVGAVVGGMPNLLRHVENVRKYGVPAVVCINQFPTDTEAECAAVDAACTAVGVKAVLSNHWAHGGEGAEALAREVVATCEQGEADFKPLYPDDMPLADKVTTIATEIYGAKDVAFSKAARTKLKRFERQGYGEYPVCMAKTQYSFSDDANLRNAPSGHTLHVEEVRLSAGAEFIVVLTGSVMTMPGLPKKPAFRNVGVDEDGEIHGLF